MNRRSPLVLFLVALSGVVIFVGCPGQAPAPVPPAATPSAAQSEDAQIQESLAKLSDADRAAAIKQQVCPVGGGKLGSMGVPPKVSIEGQDVFLCCNGCEEELRKEPATYLAKLKAK